MSDQSAPEGTAPEAAPETNGPPEWLGPITERMDEISEQVRQSQDQLAGLYYPETEEAEPEYEDAEEYGDDEDLSPEQARRIIGSEVDNRLQAELGKRDAATAMERRNESFEALQDEIPALQDDKYARGLVQAAAQELRDAGAEHLIGTPYIVDVIERLHIVSQHEEVKANAQPAPKDVVLESGSGASVQQTDEEDWGDRIVKAANSLRPTI